MKPATALTRRHWGALTLSLSVLTAGALIAHTPSAQAQARKDTAVLGMILEPTSLDPTMAPAAAIGEVVHYNILEGLTKINVDGSVSPLLAESWTMDADGKAFSFKLRKGVKFPKPCNMAASGEYVVGISFEYRASTNKAKGAPIDLVFPKEGLGWDLEAFAIHKGTKKLEAAKKLADWASSKDAMILYGKNFAITAQPGVAPPLPHVPKDYEARLVKMDFSWAADNRERILAEWTKRYNAKSEKR